MDERLKLYQDFQKEFPLETLNKMSLEKYTNLERDDSFCYWVESRTDTLGSIWGGSSYKFGIYKYQNKPKVGTVVCDKAYAWYKKYKKETAAEAFQVVLSSVVSIATNARNGNFEAIEKEETLGDSYKWKIAFLYSDLKLIPIYNREMLNTVAQSLGMKNAKKASRTDIQHFLMEKKGEKNPFAYYDELLRILDEQKDTPQYWWLVANPSIWSLASMELDSVESYTLLNDEGHKRHVFKNFLDAKKGDKVIGYEATPTLQIVSLLEIESGSDGKSIYFRKKENLKNPIEYAELKDMPELAKMGFMKNPIGSFFKLTADEYDAIMDRIREDNPLTESVTCDKYDEEDFGNEVFISKESISSLRELIKIKKNIILQGAPGVGKTFAARRLAYMMMGEKDMSRVEFVQFHQNYTYEDFIMGYKPDEEGGFRLRRGVFYNFCRKAQADSAKDYFFIIDEINRGNLSKIFGELLMLIENGYRGKEHAVKLAYSDELFFVPENLYLIGMMNTADRSLAMIDYALRRRFSFFEMRPGFDSEGFKKYQADLKNAQFDNIIEAVKQLNIVIEKDDSLGAGFCIGHSYFCNQKEYSKQWMKNVIKYDIKPMLEEYWFDNKNQRESQINNLLTLLND
jgi:5-methylcytosine-specific restriction protein B